MNLVGINHDLMATIPASMLTTYAQVPNSPELPAAYVGFPEQLTDFASGGSCTLEMKITLVVSRADEETAQQALSDLITIDLIYRLVTAQSDHWSEIAFTSVDNFRAATFGVAECLAADINLTMRST